MLWRQGDVYILTVDSIPESAKQLPRCILAEGEATGHSHRILQTESASLFQAGQQRFLRVLAEPVTLVHDEHAPVTLPPGLYLVWQQREYSPSGNRTVMD
jgi:hypothetical protein